MIKYLKRAFRKRWWVMTHFAGGVPILRWNRMNFPPLMTVFYSYHGPFETDVGARAKIRSILLNQGNSVEDVDQYLLDTPNANIGW